MTGLGNHAPRKYGPTALLMGLAIGLGCGSPRVAQDEAPAAASQPKSTASTAPNTTADLERSGESWRTVSGLRVLEVEVGEHDAALPMVVFVHGRGDIANAGWIEGLDARARYVFPQAPIPYGQGYSWFSYSARAEPASLARDIATVSVQLSAAIGELTRQRPTLGKVVVAGFSQGGMLAYSLALTQPELVSLAIPIAGMLPEPLYRDVPRTGVRYPPIRALHGSGDTLVPYENTAQMVSTLRSKGVDVELTTYEGVRHSIPQPMRLRMLELLREAIATQAKAPAANSGATATSK